MGVGGHHIEITFAHPDLAGWMRAHEANAGGNGRSGLYRCNHGGSDNPHFGGPTTRDSHRVAGDTWW
jgi:hypothetical protein